MTLLHRAVSAAVVGTLAASVSMSALANPSSKFAATYGDLEVETGVCVNCDPQPLAPDYEPVLLATIKVPAGKELLVGVSSEIGLITKTSVKGKKGSSESSIADAKATVTVVATRVSDALEYVAAPGEVTLASRYQALTATLGGVLESCDIFVDETTLRGTFTKDDCEWTDEEISLLLDTTAAHHFNFILPDMEPGEYAVEARFGTLHDASVDGSDTPDSNSASATVIIGNSVVTVQEVRAAKGGIIDMND